MSTQLTDGTNNNVVDATSKGILVQNPKVSTQAGFVNIQSQIDSGSVTGSPANRSPWVSVDNLLAAGLETPLFYDSFNYTAQNTNNWKVTTSTMTAAFGSGYMTLNSGSSVATGVYAVASTYRAFQLFRPGGLIVSWKNMITQTPQLNNAITMGIAVVMGTTASPTDGFFFQLDTTGTLRAVVSWNGTVNQSSPITAFTLAANTVFNPEIHIADENAVFWINGVIVAVLALPTGAPVGSLSASGYFFCQIFNGGTAPSTAQQLKVGQVYIWRADENSGVSGPAQQAGMGMHCAIGQNGGTMGSTALYANSAAPTAAVPTNTTAALGSGLGGHFYETATLAVGTDGIIASYQNPVGSITQTPRNLFITGYRWMSMVQTVLAGGPFVYEHGIAFGHTSVSLATTESATAKAPRRLPAGLSTFAATAAVGTLGANFSTTFGTPICVQPGEFIQTIVKNVGTVGTSGTIDHMIAFEGYWE